MGKIRQRDLEKMLAGCKRGDLVEVTFLNIMLGKYYYNPKMASTREVTQPFYFLSTTGNAQGREEIYLAVAHGESYRDLESVTLYKGQILQFGRIRKGK